MICRIFISALLFCPMGNSGLAQQQHKLSSPDKNISLQMYPGDDVASLCTYDFSYKKNKMLSRSSIGLESNANWAAAKWRFTKQIKSSKRTTWTNNLGERKLVPDNYNQIELSYISVLLPGYTATVTIRAYNEGFAFKYRVTGKEKDLLEISNELSAFNFTQDGTALVTTWAQGPYKETRISEIGKDVERPLTIKTDEKTVVSIGEAALEDFARMKFKQGSGPGVAIQLSSEVQQRGSLESPWRFMIVGDSYKDLLSKNYLVLNLNKPSVLANSTWIKPGKVIRDPTLTTKGALATIDFAAKTNLQYILFDAGWYGKEDADSSDAKRVAVEPRRYQGPFDLQQIIDYGKQKNVGVILYVNRRSLERQLDTLLPIYQKWGVKGLKFGFVNVGSQQWTSWLHRSIKKAADYKMIVDVHDEYRPTGLSRTYPNLLTQEGIRGDEEKIPNELFLYTVFTRMIAGAGDQTNCYFTDLPLRMGSHTSQLAKSVCIFSPLQFLFWYDRPALSPKDTAEQKLNGYIRPVPELDFFKALPTVWDETKILEGEPGEFVTIVRKKEGSWFLGSVNGTRERKATWKFSFLDPNKKYRAIIYTDDPNTQTITHVKVEEKIITAASVLSFSIGERNGVAMQIVAM